MAAWVAAGILGAGAPSWTRSASAGGSAASSAAAAAAAGGGCNGPSTSAPGAGAGAGRRPSSPGRISRPPPLLAPQGGP